jgi:flagellar hook-associated protein 3 FlgL
MRISTSTLFEAGAAKISDLQSTLVRTQQQISSGRRLLTPSDDPVAAARALEVTQSQSANAQYGVNRASVKGSLEQEESVLQSATDLLQDIKTMTVNAGDPSLDNSQRSFMATELRGKFEALLGLANTRDGTGEYLFSGFQTSSQPFVQSAGGASYLGDQGQRLIQVGPARQLAASDAGDAVFEKIKNGNGTFVTAQSANGGGGANTGTALISSGSVVNAGQLTGDSYKLTFSVAAGVTTYNVQDTTTGNYLDPAAVPPTFTLAAPAAPGFSYTSGQSISFDGLQFDVSGAPGDQDQFTIQPSTNQSIFKTIDNLINALATPTQNGADRTALTNNLNTALDNLDHGIDNILTVRASIGSRLKEIDALDSTGADLDVQYAETLSGLQDLDYAKAITQLTQQQVTLSAAQQSFVKITGLSLFNYLN